MVMAELPIIGVGNYDIIRTIGKGNFASVKLARHHITKTEVAIKIIEKYRLDESDLNKVYREIQILKLLKHPHIIKLYEVIQTKTKIFLVCEYASNGEVFDYITQEEKLPEEKARKMFYQVLTAIEHCHKNFVVHRDLKAENLLLDANDNIKLADFGFGNFFQSGQNLNTWCGSPPYAAPEVFEGKLYEGPQLDIWSLGIVLYVLVCGTFPFDGSNLTSLKERVLAGRFRIPYWMSQDCENLIRRMLVVNPKKRLTISQVKKHKWLEPVVVKPETNFRNCDSPSRRSGSNQLPEFNEHILKQMQGHRMDRQKTLESLRNSTYDSLYATYHLLLDKSKHHRTSVPIESKIVNDWGRRRPSNIAEQSLAKRAQTGSPTSKPTESYRHVHKTHYLTSKQRRPVASSGLLSADEYASNDVKMLRRDVQVVEESGNDISPVHHPLPFSVLPIPHHPQVLMVPPGGNKPKYVTQPSRGHLPHQPWSFNSGLVARLVHQKSPHHSLATESHRNVMPSVTSIDEGVELRSASPSEQEMIKLAASQQRRHTLGIPESFTPLTHLNYNSGELVFQSANIRDESQADSLFGSSVVSTLESETLCDSREMAYESTPKVVLSPCMDESSQSALTQESHISYVEKQRQCLDVSPTGFREGRRASDGLLLLADGKLGEHLKKLSRTNQFPPINQEENDDSCFEAIQKERETYRPTHLHVKPEMKTNELGVMTSHSSHHVMQASHVDPINFQPYTSSNRRRSFQIAPYLADERCSSYSKGFEAPLMPQQGVSIQPTHVRLHSGQSCDQPDDDHMYQWSSWKTVTENELPNSDTLQQRRDTLPFANRGEIGTFPVWSDESMGRISPAEKSLRHSSLTPFNHIGPQSLVQVLQRRRLNRRRNIAQNLKQTNSNYQLPEFELLQIADNLSKPDSLEEIAAGISNQPVLRSNIGGGVAFNSYTRCSPELQQNLVLTENQEGCNQFGVPGYNSPSNLSSSPHASFPTYVTSHRTESPPLFLHPTAMEYSS